MLQFHSGHKFLCPLLPQKVDQLIVAALAAPNFMFKFGRNNFVHLLANYDLYCAQLASYLLPDFLPKLQVRLSERRFYQKITDIYATAMDYDGDAPATREFFAKVQNKLHYAIHGQTAAERSRIVQMPRSHIWA